MSSPAYFEHANLLCYQSEEDERLFYYLPESPTPERSPAGRPTLTLMASDEGGIVQLGARWLAEPLEIESLRAELALRFSDETGEPPRLEPAQAFVDEVILAIARVENELEPVASSTSSGMPPFTTLLRAHLDAEQKTAVVSALHGRTGFVTVAYSVRSPEVVEVEALVLGDLGEALRELGPMAGPEAARLLLDRVLEDGRAVLMVTAPTEASEELSREVAAMALDAAVLLLEQALRGEGGATDSFHLEARASKVVTLWTTRPRVADLSTWFPDETGANHIIVVPITFDSH